MRKFFSTTVLFVMIAIQQVIIQFHQVKLYNDLLDGMKFASESLSRLLRRA